MAELFKKAKKAKKEKSKLRKILEWIATGILIVLIAGTSVILIYSKVSANKDNPSAPTAVGDHYLPMIVKTDSMEPKYHVNTAIFVTKQDPESIYQEYLTTENEIDLTFDDYYVTLQHPLDDTDYAVLQSFGKSERTTLYSPMRTMTHRLFYAKINEGVEFGNGKYYFFVSGINDSQHQSQTDQYQIFTEVELYGRVTGNSDFIGGIFVFATSPWGLVILLLIPCLYMIISSMVDLFRSEEEKGEIVEAQKNGQIALSDKDKERLKEELLNQMIEEKQKAMLKEQEEKGKEGNNDAEEK